MKAFLALQARRINALSLRERAIMFVSLAVALVAAADAVVLTPRMAEQKAFATRLRLQSSELDALRAQLAGDSSSDTPAARLVRQLQETRGQLQALEAEIQRRLSEAGSGMRLPDLLERVLRRHERLLLLRLVTVTDAKTGKSANSANSANNASSATGAHSPGLPLQGVDIAVRGTYLELTQYVADAEKAMPGLRWGELSITHNGVSAELSARVYLVGELP